MSSKVITIETNTSKRGQLDIRSFSCHILDWEEANKRFYILDETKRTLQQKRFIVTPGCRIIDDDKVFLIQDVLYWPRPYHPILAINLDSTVSSSIQHKGEA